MDCNPRLKFGSAELKHTGSVWRKVKVVQKGWFCHNGSISELLGFGCDPEPIVVGCCEVTPKGKIKFLGLSISSELSWKEHVLLVCQTTRFAANRIRSEGRFLILNINKTVQWISQKFSILKCISLPAVVTKCQSDDLQTALTLVWRAQTRSSRSTRSTNRG